MIIGIGVDSIEIRRVAMAIQRHPRLKARLYTCGELHQVPLGAKAASRLASLFAAKEAIFKALGTGLAGHSWQQVEVLHNAAGAPVVYLHDQAKSTAADLKVARIHLSLAHDRGRALAFCIAEGME